MRPTLPVPLAMFFLLRCQQLPVMERVRLLDHAHKRCELPFALFLANIHHFSQSATEIVAPMAKVEFRSNVDNVALAQIGHAAGSAGLLDFPKARFAGARSFGGIKTATSFGALVSFSHFF